MDVNLTGQIAVSLSQSIIIVIAAAGFGAIVAGGFGIYRDMKKRRKLGETKKTASLWPVGGHEIHAVTFICNVL